MQGAVDGNDVALGQQLLEVVDAAAADLLLGLGRQGLVVVVEELLAVEGLEAAQDALADAADGDGAHHLALEVELVLGGRRHVPLAALDQLVGGRVIAHEDQDGHDDVLGHRDHVGARHLGHGDAAVGLVGGIEVDMVGADAGRDGELEVLGLGQALRREVAGVEAAGRGPRVRAQHPWRGDRGRGARGVTYGVVMMTSASTSSRSKVESSPSLSDVVTRVWPWSSSHLRMPSSFSVVPSSSGTCRRSAAAGRPDDPPPQRPPPWPHLPSRYGGANHARRP